VLKYLECRLLENEYLNQPLFDKQRLSKGALRNFDQLVAHLQALKITTPLDLPFSVLSKMKEVEFETKTMAVQNQILSDKNCELEQVLAQKQNAIKMLKMTIEGQISYEFKELNR